MYERTPAFEELKVMSSWSGFYDYNHFDQNAIIGKHTEINNLYLSNGFSGHGLQQAPAAGLAIAELIEYNELRTLDIGKFSFERVLNNEPYFEKNII